MSVASGIGGQAGVAAETTYGTFVAPTDFLPVNKAPFQKIKNTVQAKWLGAGRLMETSAGRVVTTQAGKGTIEMDVMSSGMGLLIQSLMGTSVTPAQQASTAAYLQTHTLADTTGKSLSVQIGLPDTSGSAKCYTFLGSKITDGEFTFEVDKEVMANLSFDCRDVDEGQTLSAASFTTGLRPFVGTDTSVKVGSYGSEAAVTGVKKASVKIERGLKTDRFYLGASGLKAEPIVGDFAKVSGTITADFVDKTIWADRFAADTSFSLVLEAVGTNIESSYDHTFRITLPACYLDGDTPMLNGPDVISGDFPFVCLFDETNLPVIEYITTDTSI